MVDAGRSRRGATQQGRAALEKAGANAVGAVLNRIPGSARSAYDGYYGGLDGSPDATAERARRPDEVPERPGAPAQP